MGVGEEDKKKQRRQGHPLLRGGGARKEPYTHGFSATQMLSLAAACGALVPSLPPDGDHPAADSKAVRDFFLASAADPPVPDEVAQLMSAMCLREALALVRTVLWLLGTRLGTLALCGARCLSPRFPFVRRFAEMPVERREDALRRWSRETLFPPLRLFFILVKVFCLYVFYSWIGHAGVNIEEKALHGRLSGSRGTNKQSKISRSSSEYLEEKGLLNTKEIEGRSPATVGVFSLNKET